MDGVTPIWKYSPRPWLGIIYDEFITKIATTVILPSTLHHKIIISGTNKEKALNKSEFRIKKKLINEKYDKQGRRTVIGQGGKNSFSLRGARKFPPEQFSPTLGLIFAHLWAYSIFLFISLEWPNPQGGLPPPPLFYAYEDKW